MPRITFNSIWGGEAPSQYFAGEDQYMPSVGVDPDLPISDAAGDSMTSGVLRPSAYEDFSGAEITGNPYWFLTNPKDTKVYVYQNNGKVTSYSSSLASETNVGTPTSGAGNGAAYYNNYLYFATPTDVSRYGPLDGSPSLTNTVWTGSTLGSQTALVNTTYPSILGSGVMPNHAMHVHTDNQLYFCDFDSSTSDDTTRGKGMIHAIKTTYGSDEGDTNDNSLYNVLDLPLGYMPVDIESYGNDLVVAAIQTSDGTIQQGKAALFFWDTVSDSFYNIVELPDTLVTSLLNNNGFLFIWSGAMDDGYRLSVYEGGQTTRQLYFTGHGSPPLAGAVDGFGDRIVWGTHTQISSTTASTPEYYANVMALGSKDNRLGSSGVHCIINSTASGTSTDGVVTALKQVQQDGFSKPQFIVGHRDAGGTGIDKAGTTYGTNVWRSRTINVGQRFNIKHVRMSLGAAVAASMTITPKVFLDDFSSSSTQGLTVINNTNYANSERHIEYYPTITGDHNFCLELRWSGTALLPVLFPIIIDIELIDD